MTLKLPQRKVAAIIRQSLEGKPQGDIAQKEGVNQATVSLWWTRFRERSQQVGLSTAGKEFGVYNEVDELRSLAVQLDKAGISVTQAREGAKISQAFADLGVAPEQHIRLVKACRDIDQPGFVNAACQLAEIQEKEGITYEEAPVKLKRTVEELRGSEAQLKSTRSELEMKQRAVAKANKELAGVGAQVAAANRNARDQEATLKEQVQAAMRKAGVEQAEIQEVAQIKRDLARLNLQLPALGAVAGEFRQRSGVDTVKLGQAIDDFGSLERANDSLRRERDVLIKGNGALSEEKASLGAQRNELLHSLKVTQQKDEEEKQRIREIAAHRIQYKRQQELFDGFVAMLCGSPSRAESAECIKSLVTTLSEDEWLIPKTLEDPRSLFVRTIMGDFLRCFHCDNCGASFIVNKETRFKQPIGFYSCPACQHFHEVKPNDSFLRAMVSDKQLENVRLAEQLESENLVLRPFKAFLELPCAACHQPIREWTDDSVRSLMRRTEQLHPQCWRNIDGQMWMVGRLAQFMGEHGVV